MIDYLTIQAKSPLDLELLVKLVNLDNPLIDSLKD